MDELTQDQIAQLRDRLIARRGQLEDGLRLGAEGTRPVDLDEPIGRLSRMDAIQQQKMAQASRRQQEAELGRVHAAIAAIEGGDYGRCNVCEEPIGFQRLLARPDARVCITCQGRREQGQDS